jgi:3D (Asp-Asp-Asp) domain-containing protein
MLRAGMTNAMGPQASAVDAPVSEPGDGADGGSCGAAIGSGAVGGGVGGRVGGRVIDAVVAAVRPLVRSAASLLADILDRIVHGIRCMPLVLAVGCQPTSDAVDVSPAVEPVPGATIAKPEDTGPRQLGQFTITFYYVVGEDEVTAKSAPVAANDNRGAAQAEGEGDAELAAITPDLVTLYAGGGTCAPIAEVSRAFATQLAVQGTGKLHDGRVLNIWGACNCKRTPCFKVTQAQWGTAGSGKPLQPFRTVAVDPRIVKLGSLLYVPLLEGRTMPGRQPWGGYVHDGCVIADDTGGHIAGNRIDLFVGRKAYLVGLGLWGSGGSHAWARHVPVFDGTGICERKGRQVARKAGAI